MIDQLLEPNLKKEIQKTESLKIIPPVGFLDMIALEKNALFGEMALIDKQPRSAMARAVDEAVVKEKFTKIYRFIIC